MNKRIIRIDENEFELEDGSIYKHPEPLEEIPSIQEFQKIYDKWTEIIKDEQ